MATRNPATKQPQPEARECVMCGETLQGNHAALCPSCVKKAEGPQKKARPAGAARTSFGTRVATAVTCDECGKRDHVGYRPKKGARILCRDCAGKMLGQFEVGVAGPRELKSITCSHCGRVDELPARLPQDIALLCRDCYMGVYSYQGDRSRTGERRKSGTILSRRKRDKAAPADDK